MFGYIRIHKPELTMGDYDRYQGVYCTLCRRIGRQYGLPARLMLSYDFTFLAIFRMAVSPHCVGFEKSRCVYNPLKKCLACRDTEAVDYAAACAVLLLCGKLRDNVRDGGFGRRLAARLGLWRMRRSERKAADRFPTEAAAVSAYEAAQQAAEAAGASLDRAAEPTAALMQSLFSAFGGTENERRVMGRIGYCLGRFIYLADAADDYWDDAEQNGFNPFVRAYPPVGERPDKKTKGVVGADEELRAHVRATLNMNVAEAMAAYQLLEVRRFGGILSNVLEQGLPEVIRQLLDGKEAVSR